MFRVVWLLAAFAVSVSAQESRGTILGRVTDPSGAAVAGAKVVALNPATNTRISSETNSEGNYEIPYLLPGVYTVTAEMAGFAKAVSENIELRVADRLVLNFALVMGSTADSVTVRAEAPMLESATASLGMVMDEKRVKELPVIGGNAFYLTRLSPGVTATGGHSAGNPMDLGAASGSVVVNGARSGNSEVTLDGVPNMQETNAAYSPPQDLVQEFKVETLSYDASLGHAAGAVVNVSMKSGTNQLHGTGYYFDSRIRAVPWFSNNWLYDPSTGPVDEAKRRQANPGWLHQRWGATFSGPVALPKLYNGRDRTFWTFGYEGLHISRQPTFFETVPTQEERRGDFSKLLALGTNYQIYDPATIAAAPGGRFSRQPLPGNIIPASRISPIALKILELGYPLPNTAGTADFRQNYFGVQREPKDYMGYVGRLDHVFTERHRIFLRLNASDYLTSVQQLPNPVDGRETTQRNYGLVFDDVYVFSPRLLLNVRAGLTYFRNVAAPFTRGFDLRALGFSGKLVDDILSKADAAGMAFPIVAIDSGAYAELSSDGGTFRSTPYTSLAATLTRISGNHTLRMGGDFRLMREYGYGYGSVAPRLEFTNQWTRGPLDNSPGAPIGQGLASLLLGLPSGGSVNVNASRAQQGSYSALFLQDDWKLLRNLSINLGLRWEYEAPITERWNRSIRNFDFSTPSPISAQALANYSRSPIPEVAPSQFRTLGGLTFAGVNNPRTLWNPDRNNFSPRIGIAWTVDQRTVLRTGYGIFFGQIGADRRDVSLTGFNQPTMLIPSTDNGLSFRATLADPFPTGIDAPAGASGGLSTFLGRSVTPFHPQPSTPYNQRWSFSIQRAFPGRVLVETSYVGNRGNKLGVSREYTPVPREYLSALPERDQATIDRLSAQVNSPFAGIPAFAGTGLANTRIRRDQLLKPFPHFSSITANEQIGYSWYHALQISAQKRLSHGLTLQLAYTWSKFMEAISFLNETDSRPEHVISDQDFPMRLTLSGIYRLPFGRGERFGGGLNRIFDALAGGWQIQAWYEGQSGQALGFGNAIFRGELAAIPLPEDQRTRDRWFNIDAGFERNNARQLASNIRVLSTRFTGVRSDGINNLDASLFKNFKATERYTVQFRMETYNTLNHVQFANPNTTPTSTAFGKVTAEKGHGQRQLTFAIKLLF